MIHIKHHTALALILKNSCKNAWKKKTQVIGLSLLVTLLTLVLALTTSIDARVMRSAENLKAQSNLHDVVLQLDPYERVLTGNDQDQDPNLAKVPTNLVEAQQYWLDQLQKDYQDDPEYAFQWSRTEGREFSQVLSKNLALTLKVLAKITPLDHLNQQAVDQLVIFSGRQIKTENTHEVVLDTIFAQKHNLQLGDIIRIQKDSWGNQLLVNDPDNIVDNDPENQEKYQNLFADLQKIKKEGLDNPDGLYAKKYGKNFDWYQIVGFGGSADFTMPVLDSTKPIPNRDQELLIYINPLVFGLKPADDSHLYYYDQSVGRLTVTSNNEWESFYSLKIRTSKTQSLATRVKKINADFKEKLQQTENQKTYFYALGDKKYRFNSRTSTLETTISFYNLGTLIIWVLLTIVVIYSLALVIRKQIESAQSQIGVLKALGYSNGIIMFNFMAVPFFASFFGGIIGFALGGSLSSILVNKFMEYFILNYGKVQFNWPYFLLTIFGLWIFMTAITFLTTYLVLRKGTLSLVQGPKTPKLSHYDLRLKAKYANHSTGQKVRIALLLDAKGKMSVVGCVVLLATMMFTIFFAAPNLLHRNEKLTYAGVNYKQIVEYNEPVYNNPFTFLKTFNNTNIDQGTFNQTYKLLKTSNKKTWTALPIQNNGEAGAYDMSTIMQAYSKNTFNSHYYSLLIDESGSDPDKKSQPDFLAANLQYLSGQNIASSTEYYRFMTKYGYQGIPFLTSMIMAQWPDYVYLMGQLKQVGTAENAVLIQNFKDLQSFYARVTNSIGLSVTNAYYDTNDNQWWDQTDNWKIGSFNQWAQESNNLNQLWTKTNEAQKDDFNQYLKNLKPENVSFALTDSEYGVGAFRIVDEQSKDQPKDYKNDYFLTLNPQDLSETELKQTLVKFIYWFGTLISLRPDQGIIQAAYSRSPYFVQQFLKEAYQNQKNYNQSFGVVPFDPQLEALGTKMRVQGSDGKIFKIYGLQKENRFLNLSNKKHPNLLQELYQGPENGLIINKSLAKKLHLKVGKTVTWNVLQTQLENRAGPVKLNGEKDDEPGDWVLGTQRKWDKKDPTQNGFTPINNLNDFSNTVALNVGGKKYSLKALQGIDPYYKAVLKGVVVNHDFTTPHEFQIVGIHEGYGSPQAWMQEKTVQKQLQFDKMQAYNWKNFFGPQWGNTFAKDFQVGDANFKGIKELDFSPDNQQIVSYEKFIEEYLNNSNSEIKATAQIIEQIFENAFPIFNYKYSLKDDIGDLGNVVSVFQPYGDYSPIAMQGQTANGADIDISYDGMGEGAMNNILPISVSQAVLNQISTLVRLLLALIIIAILLITFVIILLTTALIIDDNSRFIATLKVLGYSDPYIAKTVLGMYFILIAVVYFVGFIIGWFVFVGVIKAMTKTTIVLPLTFPIWLPFAVAAAIIGVYLIAIIVGFKTITHTNPLVLLQGNTF